MDNIKETIVLEKILIIPSGKTLILSLLIYLIGSAIAIYLSWNCNAGESDIRRIINALFAGLLSYGYVFKYLIIRYIYDWKCPSELVQSYQPIMPMPMRTNVANMETFL